MENWRELLIILAVIVADGVQAGVFFLPPTHSQNTVTK